MYDVIIVGAGPAGLTAALYLTRANKNVLVLEAKSYGGQIVKASKIENYPGISMISGYDFATNLYNQVKDKIKIIYETVIKVEEGCKVYTNDGIYESKAVIIATGLETKKLNIPGEAKFVGAGVSYCATCDGNFYKDRVVSVIGWSKDAIEDAIYLSDLASKVYLINWNDNIYYDEILNKELLNRNNIEELNNSTVVAINGNDIVESLTIRDNTREYGLDVDGVFVIVGSEPRNIMFNNVVDIDSKGYIDSNDGVHTKTSKIYVAGDARNKYLRQLTTAVSDGSIAATIAIKEMGE